MESGVPDTHCAKLQRRPAFLTNACAMISRSRGHRSDLLLLIWVAGLRTPMMGANRSRPSRRTFLLLIILFGAPMAAHCATLEDSARELAKKIATALSANNAVSLEMRNLSSLSPEEFAGVKEILMADLRSVSVTTISSGETATRIVVTLSETVNRLIWVAEIDEADKFRVIFSSASSAASRPIPGEAFPATLQSERFWEGPERILDAATLAMPNGEQELALLLPDGLILGNSANASETRIEIPPVPMNANGGQREPEGSLLFRGNILEVNNDPRICSIALDRGALMGCRDLHAATVPGLVYPVEIRGGQVEHLRADCGGEKSFWLVTGTGDDTEPDFIQLIPDDSQKQNLKRGGNQVSLPGPVIALRVSADRLAATAIVRNLVTRNYEAYRLSISCGK